MSSNYHETVTYGEKLEDYITVCINGHPAIDIFYKKILQPASIYNRKNKEENLNLLNMVLNDILINISTDFKKCIENSMNTLYRNKYLLDSFKSINPDILREEFSRLILHVWFGLYEFNLINQSTLYQIDSFGQNFISILMIKESVIN